MAVLFDTSAHAAKDRAERWSAAHETIFFPIGVQLTSDRPVEGRIEGHRLGPLNAYRVASASSVVRRTARGISAADPEQLVVGMPLRGRCVIEQQGNASSFGTQELSSWDSSHPFAVTTTKPFDLLLFVVPRTLLGPRRDLICRRVAGHAAADSPVGAIAAPFFRRVWHGLETGGSELGREDLADSVIALVRALHIEQPRGNTPAPQASGRWLVARIKAYIDQHLGEPQLGPQSIASAHYISTRYLHRLFADEGISVSDWVRYRRLEACRRDLRDPTLAGETISEIARRWALSSPAHFSRIFRDEYGCTPTEARDGASWN